MSLVNHISVAQEVYMGLPVSTDPRVCELEAGILFSRPTMEKVLGPMLSLLAAHSKMCLEQFIPIAAPK